MQLYRRWQNFKSQYPQYNNERATYVDSFVSINYGLVDVPQVRTQHDVVFVRNKF